jgi:dTMP kinase
MTQDPMKRQEIAVGAPDAVETVGRAAAGGYRRLFANTGFRNLWIGQVISGTGDWLIVGLLISVVGNLAPGSSFAVAGIMIAKILPSLLLGSLLGVAVDRFDRRRLMIACDLINGALCIGLIVTNSLFFIYLIIFLMEICNLLFYPAKNALIPALVDEQDLAAANGLSYTTQQASMLIGLLMSGAIVAVFVAVVRGFVAAGVPWVSQGLAAAPYYGYLIGERAGVALDFISFGVSAAFIYSIRVHARAIERIEGARFDLGLLGREMKESFTLLADRRDLRGLLVSIGFAILGGGAIFSVGLVYIKSLSGRVPYLSELAHVIPSLKSFDALNQQASTTLMLSFLAIGMFAGAVIVPKLAARIHLEALFVSAVAFFGVSMLCFSLTTVYWIAGIFAIAAGFFVAQVTVAGNTFISDTVEDEMRGRVFTALESVLRVTLLTSMVVVAPLGDLLSGFVGRYLPKTGLPLSGPRIALILASLIVLAAAGYAMRAVPWLKPRGEKPADA